MYLSLNKTFIGFLVDTDEDGILSVPNTRGCLSRRS